MGRRLSCGFSGDLGQIQAVVDNFCLALIFIGPDAVVIFHFFDFVSSAILPGSLRFVNQYNVSVQMAFICCAGGIVIAVAHSLVKYGDIIGTFAGSSISGNNFVVACRLVINTVGISTHEKVISATGIQIVSIDSAIISTVIFIFLIIIIIEVDSTASKSCLIGYF